MLNSNPHNPDVLTCLANLSSDEVFTPPKLANEILDHLPKELWSDPEAKFLDPFCKSGVFLREIAKRLLIGLEAKIPDQQERINHIFKRQIYGIAITELTALLCRRSVYCSKTANGEYSVCDQFEDVAGNIRFERVAHTWKKGKCSYCGASEDSKLARGAEYEGHAYEFIHTKKPEDIFNMKFDVIIGNPPYQLSDGGAGASASPIYHKFVKQAKKLNPRFLSMVIPARWYAGGKGLDQFRDEMLNDRHITQLVDHPIASNIFPGVKINGGICYFLWERDREDDCLVFSRMSWSSDSLKRRLNQFNTFVRFNKAVSILEKVLAKELPSMSDAVSSRKPFGLPTSVRPCGRGNITLYANGTSGKHQRSAIQKNLDLVNQWKVFIGRAYGEGGEAREYPRKIIAKGILASPGTACTETYLVIGGYDNEEEASNMVQYLRTRFLRLLLSLRKNTQDINHDRFQFVPLLDMTEAWTDRKLYSFFELDAEEIHFLESMILEIE